MAILRLVRSVAVAASLAACGSTAVTPPVPPAPKVVAAMRSGMATGAGGVQLHYLDFGGSGVPIVLLAGAGNSAWIYSDLGKALARDHRVLAVTRRGHGESDQPTTGYDLATLDEDLRRFLDEMKLANVVLVGHSLAGSELTYFATHHPERVAALVYLDAAYDRSTQEPLWEAEPYTPPSPTDADRSSVEAMTAFVRRTRPDLARYSKDPVERDLRVSISMRDDHTAGWRTGAIWGEYWKGTSMAPPDYSTIRAPVLAIYSVEDTRYQLPADASDELVAAQRQYEAGPMATWRKNSIAQVQRAPSAEIVEMDAGHHMFIHRPEETLGHIRRFLAQRVSSPR